MLRAPMRRWLKRTLVELTAGAALGFLVWCLLGKRLTSMRFGSIGGTFSCQADVDLALDEFVAMQLYSAIAGAVLAFVLMLVIRRWWSKRGRAPEAGASGPVR